MCLHKALDPKLIKAIEQDVVPHLQHLRVVPEAAPDLTRPDAGVPALTLVFDREGGARTCSSGWPGAVSPASLGQELQGRGLAAVRISERLEVLIHGPAGTGHNR